MTVLGPNRKNFVAKAFDKKELAARGPRFDVKCSPDPL